MQRSIGLGLVVASLSIPAACSSSNGSSGGQAGAGAGQTLTSSSSTSSSSGASSSSSTSGAASSSSSTSSTSSSGSSSGQGGAGGAQPTTLDLHDATLYDNPPDLANWPVTTKITSVSFQYNGMDGVHVEFDKRNGPNAWPPVTPPGWMGPLEYTLGMAEYINGKWYASAAIEFWPGLDASGGNVAANQQIAKNWFYDAGRWGMLAGRQPATGELIGIFVVAGNARAVTTDDPAQSPVMERSDVVLMPMPDVNGATYNF